MIVEFVPPGIQVVAAVGGVVAAGEGAGVVDDGVQFILDGLFACVACITTKGTENVRTQIQEGRKGNLSL